MENGCVTKAVCYYESGQIKSLFICEDCDTDGEWDNCPPKKCFSIQGDRIKCP